MKRWLPFAAHVPVALWMFSGPVFAGKVLYLRDVFVTYLPDYVFVSHWLRRGVWPLWNPLVDAGAPFLSAYPPDLLLAWAAGPYGALAFGPPLHLVVAGTGATLLARLRGNGGWSAWLAGAVYMLSGCVLSCGNLLPILAAVAWAPWVAAAALAVASAPSSRPVVALAAAAALEISALSAETAVQTALVSLVLVPAWSRRTAARLAAAGALAALLAAPTLLGMHAVLDETARGRGFTREQALTWSAGPMVLLESAVPRLFGDVHTFGETGYAGQPFFSSGYPYFLSLYLGPAVLLLAAAGASRRLAALAALGLLLSLGAHGPLALALPPGLPFRVPVKFFWTTTIAVSLMAGDGLDRARRRPGSWWALAPGILLVAAAAALAFRPALLDAAGRAVPFLARTTTRQVAIALWPEAFARTGALALGAALALGRGRRLAPWAAVLAVADLAIVNASVNVWTERSFYELRPAVSQAVHALAAEGRYRWFSFGASGSGPLHWTPAVVRPNRDVALYSADRQALLPRTHVLDGLEGAYDEDRAALAPAGASLPPRERTPARLGGIASRLRLANVRWIVGFRPLAPDVARPRAWARVAEVEEPLRIDELEDPLPRAFWVPGHEVVADRRALDLRLEAGTFDPRRTVLLDAPPVPVSADAAGGEVSTPTVTYDSPDPHTVVVTAVTPPGLVLVLDGFAPGWSAERDARPTAVARADGRYRALVTPGGSHTFVMRYRPGWVVPSFALLALGLAASAVVLAVGGAPSALDTRRGGALASRD